MKERFAAAILAGVTVAGLGCMNASERPDSLSAMPHPAAEATQPGISHNPPSRIRIDPEQLLTPYPELPAVVARVAGAAVALHPTSVLYDTAPDGTLKPYLWKGSNASGSIADIGPTRAILTAAHVVDGQPGACGETKVELDLDGNSGTAARKVSLQRQSRALPQPLRGVTLFTSHDGLDAAVLLPKEKESLLPDQPTPTLQKEVDTPPGTVLFAINYQPTNDEQERAPSVEGKLGTPAIYAHIVIGQTATHIVSFAGVKSYGEINDPKQRGGASGGMLVGVDSDYEGMVSGSLGEHTEAEIEEDYNVDMPPGVFVLKVTRKLPLATAKSLLQGAQSSPECRHPLDPQVLPKNN